MSLEELRVREELVRIALRSSPVAVFHQNADLRYVWAFNALTQHPTLPLLNRLDSDLFPADEAEQLTQWKRAVLTSGAASRHKVALTSQGQSRTFELAIEPFRDSSGAVAGILGTAVDITERIRREEQMSNLSAHLQSMHETERALTSHEIHDNITQTLAALDLELTVVASDLSNAVSLDVTLAHMKAISHLLAETVEWSERLSADLRPSLLDNLGLAAAVESAAREFGSRTGIAVIARPFENIGMTPELSTALFRIVEEGLTMVRHANATEVTISLRRQDRGMLLQIRHNGPGIAKEEFTEPRSLEFLALCERVRSFGGRTRVEAVAGQSTTISIEIPISEQILPHDVAG
jgi:PAS domain S-box-containing protein